MDEYPRLRRIGLSWARPGRGDRQAIHRAISAELRYLIRPPSVVTVEPHGLTAVVTLQTLRRAEPSEPYPLRQGYGGYPPRIHPRVYTRGILRGGKRQRFMIRFPRDISLLPLLMSIFEIQRIPSRSLSNWG